MKNKIISFDFDSTLSRKTVQMFAKELIDKGFEIIIVTSRFENEEKYFEFFGDNENWNVYSQVCNLHQDLFCIADILGIKRIYFTNFEFKAKLLKELNKKEEILFHLDDNREELDEINRINIKAISSLGPTWKGKCEKILKKRRLYNDIV